MSVAAQAWAFAMIAGERVGRSASTKLVLIRLADRADPSGTCWPGYERTAVDLDMAPSTVAAAIRELESRGLLRTERTRDAAGRDLHNIYHLRLEATPPPYPDAKRHELRRRRKKAGAGVLEFGTPLSNTRAGVSDSGTETKQTTRNRSSSTHAIDAPQAYRAAAASRKVRHQRSSGIVWYEPVDSLSEVERIEATYDRQEIVDAIAEIPAAKQPVPGVIERLILLRRRQALADAGREHALAEHHRRVLAPCEDRETATRKALAQIAAYRDGSAL